MLRLISHTNNFKTSIVSLSGHKLKLLSLIGKTALIHSVGTVQSMKKGPFFNVITAQENLSSLYQAKLRISVVHVAIIIITCIIQCCRV